MIKKFFSNWQEPLQWFPWIMAGAFICLKVIPRLDPTAGVDGLGFISGLIQSSGQVAFIFFWTWMYRRTYGHSDEEGAVNSIRVRENYPLFWFVFEKLHQLIVLILVYLCFKS